MCLTPKTEGSFCSVKICNEITGPELMTTLHKLSAVPVINMIKQRACANVPQPHTGQLRLRNSYLVKSLLRWVTEFHSQWESTALWCGEQEESRLHNISGNCTITLSDVEVKFSVNLVVYDSAFSSLVVLSDSCFLSLVLFQLAY